MESKDVSVKDKEVAFMVASAIGLAIVSIIILAVFIAYGEGIGM